MPNAVDRVSSAIEAIACAGEASAAELAAELGISRQAVGRLLDDMMASGLVVRGDDHRRYALSLRVFSWGSLAVERHLPSATTRMEIARLAANIPHSVLYTIRGGASVFTIERTHSQGGLVVTNPTGGTNHWSNATTGRILVAFAPAEEREALLARERMSESALSDLKADLELISRQGFAERHTTAIRYTMAAPVFDELGYAVAALAIVVANFDESEREGLISALKETAARCAANLSANLMLAAP